MVPFELAEAKWRRLGRRFGYPDCCINAYVDARAARIEVTARLGLTPDQCADIVDHFDRVPCNRCLAPRDA